MWILDTPWAKRMDEKGRKGRREEREGTLKQGGREYSSDEYSSDDPSTDEYCFALPFSHYLCMALLLFIYSNAPRIPPGRVTYLVVVCYSMY